MLTLDLIVLYVTYEASIVLIYRVTTWLSAGHVVGSCPSTLASNNPQLIGPGGWLVEQADKDVPAGSNRRAWSLLFYGY
jgi:hypothetical protein